MLGCWVLIKEEKAQINIEALKATTRGFKSALKSKTLWICGLFLFFYNFSPSFGTPLYYYMSNELKFTQSFIGVLGALGAVGAIAGSFLYFYLEKKLTLKWLLYFSIFMGTIAQGIYLWLGSPATAIIFAIFNGIIAQVALVSSLTLAAYACPSKAEGFSYALLLSINNLAGQLSANVGAIMYVHWFHERLNPLILVSCAFTLFALFLVPILKLGNRRAGDRDTSNNDGKLEKK
jgi:predicted MFS family arabinose efflux permease